MIGSAEIDSNNIKGLTYVRYCLDETLRLYPPALSVNGKTARNDDILPNGAKVFKNQKVTYFAWAVHRLPEYWDDPDSFKPERWGNLESLHSLRIFRQLDFRSR